MDKAGIDVAVLSLTTPGVQNLDPQLAVELAVSSNDRLAAAVQSRSDRFQGFATLPTPSPQTAAKELERAVRQLGFNGALVLNSFRISQINTLPYETKQRVQLM
jgi:predicted TIM-barrel fold metal-dependent hydrolase